MVLNSLIKILHWLQASEECQQPVTLGCIASNFKISPLLPSGLPEWVFHGKQKEVHLLPSRLLNSFRPHSPADNCSDLNSELQRVLTGLENVVCCRKKSSCSLSVAEVDRHIEQLTTASEHCDLAIKVNPPHRLSGVLSSHGRNDQIPVFWNVVFSSNH